jgi:peptidoglycan/LPS O-acetylase OafA/YrhL
MVHQKYIPSIDGLRALAVLSVILFHAFPLVFPGGFIGVDIFFVISGYLITQIIVSQAISNQFSFGDFYSRRIRRIFPSLILVFLVVYVVGWFVMLPGEFMQLGKHIAAGASFISNWVYWLEAGYFDELVELKPLLNLWSLGVEEQFYIFWPLIILVLIRFGMGLRNALIGLVLASFLINILLVKAYPSATFYLPFSRTWELGLGGLIAVYPIRIKDLRFNHFISILGICGVIAPIFYLNTHSVFPGWSVVPPVIGTGLLLIAIANGGLAAKFLSASWMIGLGLISYPLYLWHWPALSFGGIIKGTSLDVLETIALLLVSLVFALFSYFVIEKKVRYLGVKSVFVLCLLMMGICFQGWNTYHREGLEFRLRRTIEIPFEQKQDFVKWEHKGMLPTGICEPGFIYPEAHVCAQSNAQGEADVVVLGDSHAFSAYWGIAKAYSNDHIVRLIGQGGCLPFLDASSFGMYSSCNKNIHDQIAWITNDPTVKTIFIAHRSPIISSDTDQKKLEESVIKTFDKLLKANKRVIYINSVPELNFEPRLCVGDLPFGRKNPVGSCSFPLDRELARQARYRESMNSIFKKYPTVSIYEPAIFLCRNEICNAVIDDRVMYTDTNHLSESGSIAQGVEIKKKYPLN